MNKNRDWDWKITISLTVRLLSYYWVDFINHVRLIGLIGYIFLLGLLLKYLVLGHDLLMSLLTVLLKVESFVEITILLAERLLLRWLIDCPNKVLILKQQALRLGLRLLLPINSLYAAKLLLRLLIEGIIEHSLLGIILA
jgi:hypothetical protein